jgi:hypothetical protein
MGLKVTGSFRLTESQPDERRRVTNGRKIYRPVEDLYEIRPRQDGDGVDLISDQLQRGPIWYAGPDAVRNAVAYAKFHSHPLSRRAIIRVLDQSGAVTQTHFKGATSKQ